MQRRLVAWLVLVLVVLAACSEGSAKGGQIEGTRWVLRSFDEAGTQTLVQGAAYADARFSSGRVRGFAGCGTYDALARANGRTLLVSAAAVTLQSCGEELDTFQATYALGSGWLDALLAEHGIAHERTVLGGFSQGAVMSYAFGLGQGRPRPAGILALSGFVPTVEGWEPDPATATGLPVAVGHGTLDPVIPVEFGRDARDRLSALGAELRYRESPLAHTIDPRRLPELTDWVAETAGPVSRA